MKLLIRNRVADYETWRAVVQYFFVTGVSS